MRHLYLILLIVIFSLGINCIIPIPDPFCAKDRDDVYHYAESDPTCQACTQYSSNPSLSSTCDYTGPDTFMDAFEEALEKKCLTGACTRLPKPNLLDTYDHIIVGSGPGGCAAASVLGADGQSKVLVLEAGDLPPTGVMVPSLFSNYVGSSIDWQYDVMKYPTSTKKFPLYSGKVSGGSSTMANFAYIRGHASDYNNWADITGDSSWSYEHVLERFKNAEKNLNIGADYSANYHGVNGKIPVAELVNKLPIFKDIFDAASQRGYPIGDLNVPVPHGFSSQQYISTGYDRWNAPRIFLDPMNQGNVHFALNANVTNIELLPNGNSGTYKADGVTFYDENDVKKTVRARHAVILCAGAVGTAKLLITSGIGDATDLTNLGIDVKVDAHGVGYNFQSHERVKLCYNSLVPAMPLLTATSAKKYLDTQSGPMVTSGLSTIKGKMFSDPSKTEADIELGFDASNTYTAKCTENGYCNTPQSDIFTKLTLQVTLTEKNRPGYLVLKREDPLSPLDMKTSIVSDTFGTPEELDLGMKGIDKAMQFMKSSPLTKYGFTFDPTQYQPCDPTLYITDSLKFWNCVMREHGEPGIDACGTVRMGKDDDLLAVCDSKGRVKNVDALWVADASLMPKIPHSSLMASVYMIGEKIAENVLQS